MNAKLQYRTENSAKGQAAPRRSGGNYVRMKTGQPGHDLNERGAMLRHDMLSCLTAMRFRLAIVRRKQLVDDVQLAPLAQAIAQMELLVEEWRQLSRDIPGEQRVFSLTEMVRSLVEARRADAAMHGVSLSVRVTASAAYISGSESAIQRAIDNLLSNALKYTPERGNITVTFVTEEGGGVLIIQDTGIGIPVDEQSRVFDAYYRARNARDQGISGTGLGLSQVKEAVERHGGQIHLHSDADQGTRVEILLPLAVMYGTSST